MKQSLRLLATAARRHCTGESHQALAGLTDGTPLAIPGAASREQAELEASVLLRVCGVGSMTPHPAGIVRVRPEPDRLSVQLVDEPYVVQYWAERILPVVHDTAVDPRDGITGVYGVRYRVTGGGIELYQPGNPAPIRLGGFNRRWWELAAERRRRTSNATFALPQWTAGCAARPGRGVGAGTAAVTAAAPHPRHRGCGTVQQHQYLVQRFRAAGRDDLRSSVHGVDRAAVSRTDCIGLEGGTQALRLPHAPQRGFLHRRLPCSWAAADPLRQPALGPG
ncbi:hypothetical protein [Streptomyces buecherae]|uniref:hypothetical protein n=1 Tax=Streptomyces buecherae TaxID=2763006 RepID=UPI00365AC99D